MGNDQLLPAYNIQIGVADEYIAVADVMQYRSDMDCFVPLMEKFHELYGFYPRYPVADAGYGSFNNYLFCQEHGMEKFMKFPMYKKETTDEKYHDDPFRAVNFETDSEGDLICPNGRKFHFAYRKAVKGNQYGRQEEYYTCEDCSECPYAERCKKTEKNRTVRINAELSSMHQEVCMRSLWLFSCMFIKMEGLWKNGIRSTPFFHSPFEATTPGNLFLIYTESIL